MDTFVQLQDDLYFWLGTTDSNRAFPRAQLKRVLNMAGASLYDDIVRAFPDSLTTATTLAADTGDNTLYTLASQSPAVTNLGMVVEVRLTNAEGSECTEVPLSERHVRPGYTYSVTGLGASTVFYAGRSVPAGNALYLAYVPAYVPLSADNDQPTWLPDGFGDVLSLAAAELAYGSGNEQTMSPALVARLMDRKAQLWQAVGQRSLSPMVARR